MTGNQQGENGGCGGRDFFEEMKTLNDAGFGAEDPTAISVPPDASPLDFLRRVYLDARQSLPVRLKAAIAAANYCHPRLAITAQVQEGGSIADRIERARKRSEGILEARFQEEVERRLRALAAPAVIEAKAPPLPQGRAPTPLTAPFQRMRRS
jgi:hypothetical protein